MIFKMLFMITVLVATVSSYSDSFENSESYELKVDCDSFYPESQDYLFRDFVSNNYLQFYYDRRNDSYEECFHFLSRFALLIDQYKKETANEEKSKQ